MPTALFGPESRLAPSASFAVRGPVLESPHGPMYMAEADGYYQDHVLFQHMLDELDRENRNVGWTGVSIEVQGGIYRWGDRVWLPSTCRISGQGASSVIKPFGYERDDPYTATVPFYAQDADEIVLEGLTFDGSQLVAPLGLGSLAAGQVAGATVLPIVAGHTLQAGMEVVIGMPEFVVAVASNPPSEVATIATASATSITLAAPLAYAKNNNAQIASRVGATGGVFFQARRVSRVVLRHCRFTHALRHCVWLEDVDELVVDGCTFEHWGDALVARDPWSTFAFGIGGFGVGRMRVSDSLFQDSQGRRSAGIELRMVVNEPSVEDRADVIVANNSFLRIYSPDLAQDGGAGMNLVCAENSKAFSRIVIQGNTFDNIGDGFVWILSPTGHVAVTGNTCTTSHHGPMIEVDAPHVAIVGNTCAGGEAYAGIWVRCSPGTGDFAAAASGLDFYGATISNNVVRDMRGAVGVGIHVDGGAQVPLTGPRQFVITGNSVARTNQDGIAVTYGEGDLIIANNVIMDTNIARLATTTLTQDVTFVEGEETVVHVASTEYFVAQHFVWLEADTTNRQIAHVDAGALTFTLEATPVGGAASFVAGNTIFNPFPGNAGIWLRGDAEHPMDHCLILGNRVGVAAFGTTRYGLYTSNVSGQVTSAFNDFDGPTEGAYGSTGNTPLFSFDPGSNVVGGWQTDAGRATSVHLRDYAWDDATAVRSPLYAPMGVGVNTAQVQDGSLFAPLQNIWLGAPASPNSEVIRIASIAGNVLTLQGLTKYSHGAATLAADAALGANSVTLAVGYGVYFTVGQKVSFATDPTYHRYPIATIVGDMLTFTNTLGLDFPSGTVVGDLAQVSAQPVQAWIWGPTWDGAQGVSMRLGYDDSAAEFRVNLVNQGTQPKTGLLLQTQNGDIRVAPSQNIGWVFDGTTAAFRPRVNAASAPAAGVDFGGPVHQLRNVYVHGGLKPRFIDGGGVSYVPTDADFTSPVDGMMAVAGGAGTWYLYVRIGGTWLKTLLA